VTEIKALIQNEAGIHCRPTALITQATAGVDAVITVVSPDGSCELGSALELMMLGLEHRTEVILQVEGPDEVVVADQFKKLFETEFDFPNAGQGGVELSTEGSVSFTVDDLCEAVRVGQLQRSKGVGGIY